jgi:hypothetical protein
MEISTVLMCGYDFGFNRSPSKELLNSRTYSVVFMIPNLYGVFWQGKIGYEINSFDCLHLPVAAFTLQTIMCIQPDSGHTDSRPFHIWHTVFFR